MILNSPYDSAILILKQSLIPLSYKFIHDLVPTLSIYIRLELVPITFSLHQSEIPLFRFSEIKIKIESNQYQNQYQDQDHDKRWDVCFSFSVWFFSSSSPFPHFDLVKASCSPRCCPFFLILKSLAMTFFGLKPNIYPSILRLYDFGLFSAFSIYLIQVLASSHSSLSLK